MRIASRRDSEGRRPPHVGRPVPNRSRGRAGRLQQVVRSSVEEDSRWDSMTPSRSERLVRRRISGRRYATPFKPCWTRSMPHAPTCTPPTNMRGGPRARHRPGRGAAVRTRNPPSRTRPRRRRRCLGGEHRSGRVRGRVRWRPLPWSRSGPVVCAGPVSRSGSRWSRCGRAARVWLRFLPRRRRGRGRRVPRRRRPFRTGQPRRRPRTAGPARRPGPSCRWPSSARPRPRTSLPNRALWHRRRSPAGEAAGGGGVSPPGAPGVSWERSGREP
jgi:hypothetical protein